MPTYEYTCSKCGHHFDFFQSMTEKALSVCPKRLCAETPWGKGKVKRSIGGGAGLIFKGSGFYKTDSRSDSRKTATKTAEPKSGDAAASGAGKQADTSSGSKADAPAKSEPRSGGSSDGAKASSSTGVAAAS